LAIHRHELERQPEILSRRWTVIHFFKFFEQFIAAGQACVLETQLFRGAGAQPPALGRGEVAAVLCAQVLPHPPASGLMRAAHERSKEKE
jgi:hypothetical protein